jgi:hypothetical protein
MARSVPLLERVERQSSKLKTRSSKLRADN